MPVTARLSKLFYERFGEHIANELVDWFNAVDATYRADLRELNELNFARFDSKLEQRMSALETKLEQRVSTNEFEKRMSAMDVEFADLRTELQRGFKESDAARATHALATACYLEPHPARRRAWVATSRATTLT
jgi:hypothetical protein